MNDVVFRMEVEGDITNHVMSNIKILWFGIVNRWDTGWHYCFNYIIKEEEE